MKKIVLASNNKGKLREFSALFEDRGIEVINQGALNVPGCEEPFETFLENALTKARHAAKLTGLPALADDSGICVDALGGQPGVYSARYAGEPSNDEANNQKLVRALQGKENRQGHYICVLVAVRSEKDPEPLVVEGRWQGEIIDRPEGDGGFGYDPYFYLPGERKTAAQMSAEEKNKVSHRGQAMKKMSEALKAHWGW